MPGIFTAHNALAVAFFLVKGHAAGGGFGIFLYLRFALDRFTPIGISPAVLHHLGQFGVILRVKNVTVTESGGALQQ